MATRTSPRLIKAVTRRHHLDGLKPYLDHARKVTDTAAFVAVNNNLHNRYALDGALYHRMRDQRVHSAITQGCFAMGAAMAKNIDDPEEAPTVSNPVLSINNRTWNLNPVGEAYVAEANLGTRKHPHVVAIPVSKRVGDMISEHKQGELRIGRTHFTMTYSKEAPPVRRTERDRVNIAELTSGIGYLGGEPANIMAVDMNAWGCMTGDDHTITKFDVSGRVDRVMQAKTENTPDDRYRKDHNRWRYERRHGKKISNAKVEKKRRERVIRLGGKRKIRKDNRDIARLKRDMKKELQGLTNELRRAVRGVGSKERDAIKLEFAERRKIVKAEHKGRIAKAKAMRRRRVRALKPTTRVDNAAKRKRVAKATRSLEHAMHAASVIIVMMALRGNAVLVLEALGGMADGWMKDGKFGRSLRRKLYSSAMLKFQGMIRYKALWAGIEVLDINPRNTSALCCVCREKLSGAYHTYLTCLGCTIRVNRDVNAVVNTRRTTAAARYGRAVRPGRDEAQREPDVILCSGALSRGGRSLWADREVDGRHG